MNYLRRALKPDLYQLAILILLCVSCNYRTDNTPEQNMSKMVTVKDTVMKGEQLFRGNCAKCHFICKQGIGPALAGVTKRRKHGWLVSFIRSSQQIIGSGDEYANHLFHSYSGVVMPDFEHLSVDDIENILTYIDKRTVDTFQNPKDAELVQNVDTSELKMKEKVNYYEKNSDLSLPTTAISVKKGEELFVNNCQTCHELCSEKIGAPLANVTYRRPLPWLIDFITDPGNVMEHGDEYALFLKKQYDILMPPSYLEKEDILNILAYLRHESGSPGHISGVNTPKTPYNSDRIVKASPKDDLSKAKIDTKTQSKIMMTAGHIALIVVVAATLAIFVLFFLKVSRNLDK